MKLTEIQAAELLRVRHAGPIGAPIGKRKTVMGTLLQRGLIERSETSKKREDFVRRQLAEAKRALAEDAEGRGLAQAVETLRAELIAGRYLQFVITAAGEEALRAGDESRKSA